LVFPAYFLGIGFLTWFFRLFFGIVFLFWFFRLIFLGFIFLTFNFFSRARAGGHDNNNSFLRSQRVSYVRSLPTPGHGLHLEPAEPV
jgi:hypothetical protein